MRPHPEAFIVGIAQPLNITIFGNLNKICQTTKFKITAKYTTYVATQYLQQGTHLHTSFIYVLLW